MIKMLQTKRLHFFSVIFLCVWGFNNPLQACFNDWTESQDLITASPVFFVGKEVASSNFFHAFLDREPKTHWEEKSEKLKKTVSTFPDHFPSWIQLAIATAHMGNYQETLKILKQLQRSHPKNYAIASNLGTTFELLGNNQEAFHWINEGIKLNPESHEGTEWLHVKILEAKLEKEKDPNWFKTHSVIAINFGDQEAPVQPEEFIKDISLSQKVTKALTYQLHERMEFVKPSDEVVADLLFDFGNIAALAKWYIHAERFYELASEYGYSKPILEKRKAFVSRQKK